MRNLESLEIYLGIVKVWARFGDFGIFPWFLLPQKLNEKISQIDIIQTLS